MLFILSSPYSSSDLLQEGTANENPTEIWFEMGFCLIDFFVSNFSLLNSISFSRWMFYM
jgi:hypothetical protein